MHALLTVVPQKGDTYLLIKINRYSKSILKNDRRAIKILRSINNHCIDPLANLNPNHKRKDLMLFSTVLLSTLRKDFFKVSRSILG